MPKKRRLFIGSAFMGFALITLIVCSAGGAPTEFDTVVRNAIISLRRDWLSAILIMITYLGNSQTIVCFCIAAIFFPKTRMAYGLPLSIGAACSAAIQTILKVTIMRPRPDVSSFLITQGGWSFPSGHSCTGLMFYGLLAYLIWRNLGAGPHRRAARILSAACLCLAAVIGFSRIYLGVHYPTDVLGGWCLGGGLLLMVIAVYERVAGKPAKG